jgi:formate/nitrite transporter FocA (FNT family)
MRLSKWFMIALRGIQECQQQDSLNPANIVTVKFSDAHNPVLFTGIMKMPNVLVCMSVWMCACIYTYVCKCTHMHTHVNTVVQA